MHSRIRTSVQSAGAHHDTIYAIVIVGLDDGVLDAFSLIKRRICRGADLLEHELDTEVLALLLCELRVELAWGR